MMMMMMMMMMSLKIMLSHDHQNNDQTKGRLQKKNDITWELFPRYIVFFSEDVPNDHEKNFVLHIYQTVSLSAFAQSDPKI